MDAKHEQRGWCGPLLAGFILLLPTLYVLSSGPMATLVATDRLDGELYRECYWPLAYASQMSDTIFVAWEGYLRLWTP